jgi:hypothetical protein
MIGNQEENGRKRKFWETNAYLSLLCLLLFKSLSVDCGMTF